MTWMTAWLDAPPSPRARWVCSGTIAAALVVDGRSGVIYASQGRWLGLLFAAGVAVLGTWGIADMWARR